jgi:branched-chain amino acid transport system ATP-binding protein
MIEPTNQRGMRATSATTQVGARIPSPGYGAHQPARGDIISDSMPNEVILEVQNITVNYGRVRALDDVSLQVRRGGLALVLGLNGAGKSTLMKAISGAVPARSGSVVLQGADVSVLPAHRRVRKGISMVPEGRGVLPGLSVRDNLDLGWHSAPRARRGAKTESIEYTTHLFPILGRRFEQDCSTLSGGEMQMLAIARALLARPEIMLLDEPSLGLAPKVTADVYEALAKLSDAGMTTIVVEQKAVPLLSVPETVLVLRNGSVLHEVHDELPSQQELSDLYLHTDGGKL